MPEESGRFLTHKEDVLDNLEAIQMLLQRCIEDGMLDAEDYFYNELLDLMDEALICKTNAELQEVVTKAKTLEVDVDAWLSYRGKTSIALTWPKLA